MLRWLAWPLAGVAIALAAVYAALGTQEALDYVLQRTVAAAEGRLTIEGAEGSLLSTVRIERIAWRGDTQDVEARGVALVWSPWDLVSRRFIVQGLGAKRLAFDFRKSSDSPAGLPPSLALPLEVEVRNIGVERVEWKAGDRAGAVTGVVFGYAGGATQHLVSGMRVVTDFGTLTGDARLAATAPYSLSGKLAVEGDADYRGGRADLTVTGTLERIGIAAAGTLRNAAVVAKAELTPLEPVLFVGAEIDAREVDLAQFGASLPSTSLEVHLDGRPAGAGFAGALTARNASAGPLDAGRVPLASLAARFAWDGGVLALSDVDARLPGGGRATGSASLPLRDAPLTFTLALADVDLARIQSSLLATRLSGSVSADVSQQRQAVRADVRDANLAVTLAFAATVEGRRVTVERMQARAGSGEIAGSGSVALDGARAFNVTARATRFDPARFVPSLPPAQLDGTLAAQGTLAPAWDVTASVALAAGSRVADTPVSGTAKGRITATTARDVAVDLRIASTTVTLKGGYGTAADALAYAVDVPRMAELQPLAARYAKGALPAKVGGAVRAKGTISGDPRSPGVTIDAHGQDLQWGTALAAAKLDLAGSVASGIGPSGPIVLESRPVALTMAATGVKTNAWSFAQLKAGVKGTLAQHAGSIEATAEDLDLVAAFAGGVRDTRRADGTREAAWIGTLDSLANRGTYALKLEAPAPLDIARDHVHVGPTRIAVAEGRADLVHLEIDEGRIRTQGSFTGIPVTTVARLAGTRLPFPSTMVLGGSWAIAAAPRLNGTLDVHRERGDWFATESATLDPADLALGVTELSVSARFVDDALTAAGRFRSARAGTADATATLAAGATPGRIATTAPMTATVTAELASLRPLQPWIGTAAVINGRAQIEVDARGTLAEPILAGTATGDALRFDLPQHGVHLTDGRLRAKLTGRTVALEDLSFGGGGGRFTAHGTLVLARDPAATAGSHVEWEAKDFTAVNRPDLLIIADGKGTLANVAGRLALAGEITIDKGRVLYEPRSIGTLSDDVVIVGEPPRTAGGAARDLPLALDLEVALGRDFTFSGEGLETRLGGKVRVTTTAAGTLAARGTIRAISGTYFVFGQRLDIDRGRLIFDGPADNPALDVVALRKNLAVEAGVEVTGTARVPRVRLVSNPPVPDGEKLSWLLTGQGLDRANRADLAALSAASASLLGQGRKPITTQIANNVGLDDISVRQSAASVVGGATGQVVAFGKRISDRLSLVYEQGLTVATNALRIEYALSRTVTVRAEAGTVGSVGIFYRRSYD